MLIDGIVNEQNTNFAGKDGFFWWIGEVEDHEDPLELGRVISDAPYGIRGMANNVSQLASNVLFMSQQTDAATGNTIGFLGALRNIGKALMGPLGVLLAIQAVIAAVDYFAGGMKKAEMLRSLGVGIRK